MLECPLGTSDMFSSRTRWTFMDCDELVQQAVETHTSVLTLRPSSFTETIFTMDVKLWEPDLLSSSNCVRFLLQVITVSSVPGMDSDWLMGERGNQRGKVPITYLELLNWVSAMKKKLHTIQMGLHHIQCVYATVLLLWAAFSMSWIFSFSKRRESRPGHLCLQAD